MRLPLAIVPNPRKGSAPSPPHRCEDCAAGRQKAAERTARKRARKAEPEPAPDPEPESEEGAAS